MAVEVQHRREPAIEVERLGVAPLGRQLPQAQRLLGKGVHQPGDGADCAEQHGFHHQVVDAAEQDVALAAGVHDIGEATRVVGRFLDGDDGRLKSEEHTSELQSLMRISYAVFCLKKKKNKIKIRDESSMTN